MLDQFIEALKGLIDKFLHPGDNSVDTALQVLYTLPVPPISADSFKRLYSTVWAGGIILSFICGLIMVLFVLGKEKGRIGSTMPAAAKASYFLRVIVMGFVAMPIVGVLLILTTEATKLVKKIPDFKAESSSFLDTGLAIIASIVDPRQAFAMDTLAWVATTLLTMTTVGLTYAVLPALLLSPVFYGLSVLGDAGLNLWRFWVSFTLVTIFSKMLIAWWLGIGSFGISFMSTLPGLDVLGGWQASTNIMLILGASAIPWIVLLLSVVFVHPELRAASMQVWGMVSSEAISSLDGFGPVDTHISRLTSIVSGSSSEMADAPTGGSNSADASRLAIAEMLSSNATLAAAIHPAGPLVAQAASVVLASGVEQPRDEKVVVETTPAPRAEPVNDKVDVAVTTTTTSAPTQAAPSSDSTVSPAPIATS